MFHHKCRLKAVESGMCDRLCQKNWRPSQAQHGDQLLIPATAGCSREGSHALLPGVCLTGADNGEAPGSEMPKCNVKVGNLGIWLDSQRVPTEYSFWQKSVIEQSPSWVPGTLSKRVKHIIHNFTNPQTGPALTVMADDAKRLLGERRRTGTGSCGNEGSTRGPSSFHIWDPGWHAGSQEHLHMCLPGNPVHCPKGYEIRNMEGKGAFPSAFWEESNLLIHA